MKIWTVYTVYQEDECDPEVTVVGSYLSAKKANERYRILNKYKYYTVNVEENLIEDWDEE